MLEPIKQSVQKQQCEKTLSPYIARKIEAKPDYGIWGNKNTSQSVQRQGNRTIYRDTTGAITKIITYTLDPKAPNGVRESITDAYGRPIKND